MATCPPTRNLHLVQAGGEDAVLARGGTPLSECRTFRSRSDVGYARHACLHCKQGQIE